jgi:HMG box factor, other
MMAASIEVGQRNLDTPRSPVSISTDPSRRDSLKQALPEKDVEQQASISPRTRLTRKRAASLNTDSANDPRIGDLALNSASTNGPPTSDPTREQVCLCQPDPKIPRPRNGEQSTAPFSFLVSSFNVLLVLHRTCVPLLLYYLPKAPLTETRKLIFFVAFILYRQHYQAQVVAQHPGLANPEISKIIGEQWREQAPEVKSDWKRLAEV